MLAYTTAFLSNGGWWGGEREDLLSPLILLTLPETTPILKTASSQAKKALKINNINQEGWRGNMDRREENIDRRLENERRGHVYNG